jgi:hypothetical protein
MQNPKIKLYHQHIVRQRVLNKYQILLRSHQIYNPSHIHSFLQETVGEFTYLGLNFSRTGSFTNAKKVLINKAYKAIYELLKKGRLHNLSIKSQYDLFDKIEKIIILDLLELTLSFQMLQYSQKIFSCNCRSDAESENKTVSSAYSKTKSFK